MQMKARCDLCVWYWDNIQGGQQSEDEKERQAALMPGHEGEMVCALGREWEKECDCFKKAEEEET